MRKEVGLISLAASAVLVVVLVVGVVQVMRYRRIQTSQLVNLNQVSSDPGGLVVALNAPADTSVRGVMVNYLSPEGVAVRTRPIPNAGVKTAQFQLVQDDVFVYTEVGDEPGLRRMDESGSLSAGVDVRRGASGDDFWLVSSDGKYVAWSEGNVLYSAGIDGSDEQILASLTEAGEFYLRPVAWVDGQVWYVKQPVGVDGDPVGPIFSGGQTPALVDSTDSGLVSAEGAWSPDKLFTAVAVPGWVEIWDVTTDNVLKILPETETDTLHVVGWLDHDTLALAVLDSAHPFQSKIYVVNADGSFFRQVWEGYPIGVVPALE